MIRIAAVAALAAGIILLYFGINASNSLSSDVSRFFTGSPTDKTVWMLIGGALLCVAGAVGLFSGRK